MLVVLMGLTCATAPAFAAAASAKPAGSKSASTSKSSGAKKSTGGSASGASKAGSKSAPRDTSRVLVRIGKETITSAMVEARLADLPDQYRSQYATPSGRQQLLDRMIEEKVWLDVALKNGVASRPKVKQQLEQQRSDLLIRTWISEQMANNPAPSDSEAMVYYQEHQSEYRSPATVTLRHIQFASEAEARRVLPFARDPKKDFGDLVKKYSADTLTRKNGGQLGTITRDGVFPTLGTQRALADSAFSLAEGQVGGPWKTDRGWHVIRLDQKHDESTRPFDQVQAADRSPAERAAHAGLLPRPARQGEARRRRARRFHRHQEFRERAALGARAVPGRAAGHRSACARRGLPARGR